MDFPAFNIDKGISVIREVKIERILLITFPTIVVATTSEVLYSGYILYELNPLFLSRVIEAEH